VVAGPPSLPPSVAEETRKENDPQAPPHTGGDRAQPRHPRAAPAEAGVGYLSLDTDPWATAYLGGRKLGTTPFVHVALPPGRHKLSLDVEGSGRRETLQVTVAAGAESRVRKHLE
jgi:hypothetical protein